MKFVKSLTAIRLRLILSTSLVVMALLGGSLVYFANSYLSGIATEVSHASVDASASKNNVTTLEKIKAILDTNKDVVQRASGIVAASKSYQYQNQIITDLNDFAARTGVTITNVNFGSSAASGASGGAQTTPSPSVGGLNTTSATITLATPVNYYNLLHFLRAIEQNLTKMQVSRVSLSKGTAEGDNVTTDALTIEVYIQ